MPQIFSAPQTLIDDLPSTPGLIGYSPTADLMNNSLWTLRPAFRYGLAQEDRIALGEPVIDAHGHAAEVHNSQQCLEDTLTRSPKELTDSIARNSAKEITMAEMEVTGAIAGRAPDPLLVLHWEDLGGYPPKLV